MEGVPSTSGSDEWLKKVIDEGKTKLTFHTSQLDEILLRQGSLSTKTIVDQVALSVTQAIADLQKYKTSILEEFSKVSAKEPSTHTSQHNEVPIPNSQEVYVKGFSRLGLEEKSTPSSPTKIKSSPQRKEKSIPPPTDVIILEDSQDFETTVRSNDRTSTSAVVTVLPSSVIDHVPDYLQDSPPDFYDEFQICMLEDQGHDLNSILDAGDANMEGGEEGMGNAHNNNRKSNSSTITQIVEKRNEEQNKSLKVIQVVDNNKMPVASTKSFDTPDDSDKENSPSLLLETNVLNLEEEQKDSPKVQKVIQMIDNEKPGTSKDCMRRFVPPPDDDSGSDTDFDPDEIPSLKFVPSNVNEMTTEEDSDVEKEKVDPKPELLFPLGEMQEMESLVENLLKKTKQIKKDPDQEQEKKVKTKKKVKPVKVKKEPLDSDDTDYEYDGKEQLPSSTKRLTRRSSLRTTRSTAKVKQEQPEANEEEDKSLAMAFLPVFSAKSIMDDDEPLSAQEQRSAKNKNKTKVATKKSKKQHRRIKKNTPTSSDSEAEDAGNVLGSTGDEIPRSKVRKKRVVESDSEEDNRRAPSPELLNLSSDDPDFVETQKVKKSTRKRHSSQLSNSSSDETITKPRPRAQKKIKFIDAPAVAPRSEDNTQKIKRPRAILTDEKLQQSTRDAEKEEQERKKRLEARNNIFSQNFGETLSLDRLGSEDNRLLLDIDTDTQNPLIEVHKSIVKKLHPHQVEGVKFMYQSCYESVDLMKKGKTAGGCILAHCMGLGKTLQTVAFVHTVMSHASITKTTRVLIVCPKNTVTNWHKEFIFWLKSTPSHTQPKLFDLWDAKDSSARMQRLREWHREGGVGIINYDILRRMICDARNIRAPLTRKQLANKFKRQLRIMPPSEVATVEKTLLDNPGPDLIICDEGHLMRNHESLLSRALLHIGTKRRIVLTGTPLQNNLNEYHTMMQFVKPNLLGNLAEFNNRFAHPITKGQKKESSPQDVRLMKMRAHVLYKTLAGCVQRKGFEVLTPYLPEKQEYCIVLRPTEFQKTLYRRYLQMVDIDVDSRGKRLFGDYAALIKIIAHPYVLTIPRNKAPKKVDKDDEESYLDEFGLPGATTGSLEEDAGEPLKLNRLPADEWYTPLFKQVENPRDINHSGKFVVLESIIRQCAAIGDRLLIFSQFLTPLNLVEEMLKEWDNIAVDNDTNDRWRFGKEFFRIDGSTKIVDRQTYCDRFNRTGPVNRAKLFLISTRAGGLGINLFGANRVIIFDASWNPANDMQGIFRVYRLGQMKPCYIYRLLMEATMEAKIYNRQVVKLSLSSRVVDEHQVERHFRTEDLEEFYTFDPSDENEDGPTLPVPRDHMLANILMANRSSIVNYFEHDSLLRDLKDEQLTEEEKKQAWEDYENAGKGRGLNNFNFGPSGRAKQEKSPEMSLRERLINLHPEYSPSELEAEENVLMEIKARYIQLVDQTHMLMDMKMRKKWESDKLECEQLVANFLGEYNDFLVNSHFESDTDDSDSY